MPPLSPAAQAVLLALVLVAAVFDLRYRRIPNWLSAAAAALGFALNGLLQGAAGLTFAFEGFALGFSIYFAMYMLHAVGGGDVKLMSAAGALAGWQNWLDIFLITAILGGFVAVVVSLVQGRLKQTLCNIGFILTELSQGRPAWLRRQELDVRSPKSARLPHGAVIAAATVFFLVWSGYSAR